MTNEEITALLDSYRVLYENRYWNEGLPLGNDDLFSKDSWHTTTNSNNASNWYGNAEQCYGFSLFLAKVLFDKHLIFYDVEYSANRTDLGDGWVIYKNDYDNISLEPGDIVRVGVPDDGHSGVVWKYDGENIQFVQAVFSCAQMQWGAWNGTNLGKKTDTEADMKEIAAYIIKAPKTTGGLVTVTFKAPEVIETKVLQVGDYYGLLPLPKRTGYIFDGWWYSNINEDQEISMYTIVTKSTSHDLYGHWKKRYKITNVGANKCLNIYGDNLTSLKENTNVTLWSDSGTKEQMWYVSSCAGYKTVRSAINETFGLNIYRDGTNNCDVHTISGNKTDASVIIPRTVGTAKIKHANYDLYLTAVSAAEGANVYWAPSSSSNLQQWTFTEV